MLELLSLKDLCEALVIQRFESVHDAEQALEQFEKLTTPAAVLDLLNEVPIIQPGRPYLFSLAPDLGNCTLDVGGQPYHFNAAPELKLIEDNQIHRVIFSLPPISLSPETLPSVQDLPSQQRVTGDNEVDAVLWLREVIKTGQPGPIATALEAAKKIKTPMKVLEKRYSDFLHDAHPGNFFATFSAMGLGELERLATRSIETLRLKVEAQARFPGDTIWDDTAAEQFCERALKRCKGFKDYINYDVAEVEKRFRKYPDHMPHTLSDCLHELTFWQTLSTLRSAAGEWGDGQHEGIARGCFVESLLATIPPRDADEAGKVLDYLGDKDLDQHKLIAIARNLMSVGVTHSRDASVAPHEQHMTRQEVGHGRS
jgi:hypothetical protein